MILCAQDRWDSVLDYWSPNTCSPSWYLKETGNMSLPATLSDYDVTLNNQFSVHKHAITPLYSFRNVKYTSVKEVGDSKYIYPVHISNSMYFNYHRNMGFLHVSNKVKEDLRNKKAVMVFDQTTEGYSGINDDFSILQRWIDDSNIPPDSVYYITGNLIGRDIASSQGAKYNVISKQVFECWNTIDARVDAVNFSPTDEKYLFLQYNRLVRPHRVLFILKLQEHGLIDNGLVSYNFESRKDEHSIKQHLNFIANDSNLMERYLNLVNNGPSIIDVDTTPNLANNLVREHHERTFISVVSETLVSEKTLFLSEKIWKPILTGHPFIVLGSPGTLKYLRQLGFKTFSKWFDESYDDEIDLEVRMEKIIDLLKYFRTMSIDELSKIRYEMKNTCEFNRSQYKTHIMNTYKSGNCGTFDALEIEYKNIWRILHG
jgi:hypothetical protein